MTKKSKNYIFVPIRGKDWKVVLQTSSAYIRMHGKDSYAITYPKDKEIYFNKSDISLSLIRHELFHAFISSIDTEYAAKITAEVQEEIDCTVYGNNKAELLISEDKIVDFALKGGVS